MRPISSETALAAAAEPVASRARLVRELRFLAQVLVSMVVCVFLQSSDAVRDLYGPRKKMNFFSL